MGLFILGVLAAAWFGGAGPGIFAAFLSALSLPHLVATTYPFSVSYPLLAGALDLPRFVTLGLTAAAVGWGRTSYLQAESTLRERQRAEEALRESQERYERVVQATDFGLWDWDVVQDKYYVSPRFLEMNGFPPDTVFAGREDFVRRNPMHEEDLPKYQKYEQAVRDLFAGTGSRLAMEVRVLLNGEVRWRRLEGICFRDATGAVVRWTGSTTDITDRKRAELAQSASEKRYALAMEAAGDGHTDWDLQTGEHYVSPRLLELCGYAPGTTFRDRAEWVRRFPFHPEDRPKWEQAVATHFAGRESNFKMELRIVVRGEVRWTAFHFLSTRDAAGTPIRWTGSIGDITEQKQAEVALRESEERYEFAMAASESGYWDWHIPTGRYFSSARASEMVGFPAENTYTHRNEFTARIPVHPEDWAKWDAAREKLFAGTGERLAMEVRYIVGGETRWHSFQAICKRDETGNVVRWTGSTTDVTERKLAQEALRLSEERYAVAMEVAEEGHFEWNVQTDQAFFSATALRLLNVPHNFEYRTRREVMAHARFHPDDWLRAKAEWSAVLAGQRLQADFEYRVMRGEEPRWIHGRWEVFRDAHGVVQRLIGVISDVTERKRVEEALSQSEERYALAVAGSNEGIFDWDLVSDRVYVSYRAQELFRLPRGELWRPRRDWRHILAFHPEDAPRLHDSIKAHIAGSVPTYDVEFRIVVPDGEVRWFRQRGIALRDPSGKSYRVVGSIGDVTERKRIEEELRSRQEMLDVAQKSARVMAFEWKGGASKGENTWPPDLEAMHGQPPGAYDGSIMGWKKLIHPEDLASVNEALVRGERTGDIALQYRVVHPDKSVHWVQTRGRMFVNAAGRTERIVGFAQEITQSKQAEAELRKMEEELRRAQRLESIGTLAGGIAHDFNNILGAILGYGEMAMRDVKKGTRLRRDLQSIMAAGERGRSLVDRILAFSRSGVGERVPVHVQAVVREALGQIAASLPGNVVVARRLRAGRGAMLGDSTQVHQVVMNLVSNAVQAMSKGGVLRVSLETARIDEERSATVGSLVPGDYIVLRVTDTGDGIPDAVLERMFDPFFTTKEVGTGSGLGLSLVHGIVTSVDGAIDVATELRKGTTFTVYLRRSGDAPEKPADEDPPLLRGAGERVLVVEDEAPLLRLATETLESLGYAPVGFTSSAAALAAFRTDPGRFDAVLTDERMPGLSGSALIREVRGIREAIPVVLMSGYLGMESVDADVVVRKPLSARDLAASMARALEP